MNCLNIHESGGSNVWPVSWKKINEGQNSFFFMKKKYKNMENFEGQGSIINFHDY